MDATQFSFPRVEDHLVEAEVTRDEIIGGRQMTALPADPPRATQRTRLNYVVRAHVAFGYSAASDLLTRYDEDSDFASDTCILKDGIDPETGDRYLEEIAYFVVAEQNERRVQEKVPRMFRRGVRRVFGLFVEGNKRVCEWSTETESWSLLGADTQITDSCLVAPFTVTALLDRTAADKAVFEALIAKRNPMLLQWEQASGKAETVLTVLAARSIALSEAQRQEIVRCRDLDLLNLWLRRAVSASSTDEVIAGR